jgi:serine protease AprX
MAIVSLRSPRLRAWLLAGIAVLTVVSAPRAQSTTPPHRARLSADLSSVLARVSAARTRVLVDGSRANLTNLVARHRVQVVRWLDNGAVLALNPQELAALSLDPVVDHLSGDLPVRPSMVVSNASTMADKTRAGAPGLLGIGAVPGVTGAGIVVAVVDSGIAPHPALAGKVIANVSFVTGDPRVTDVFGHGTHVAGIIAGTGAPAARVTTLFNGGIAPGAQLVNVRVLGADGSGLTSDVIAGIDWVIANRARYNIRVINLSLGHPVTEPALTDPLCQAVARATAQGIVVVASAGNDGMTADGRTVLGSIVSPGNSPFALTVGALDTQGTAGRSDDTVASYSSRGPARFDMTVKPDVVAPGNRIVSLEADQSWLVRTHPTLHRAGVYGNAYMQLSGTSMATPIVSGAVALLLQGSPTYGPAQTKLALQTGATFVRDGGLMGGGAGSVNIWGSRQLAARSSSLTSLLGLGADGVAFWDAGTLSARLYNRTALRLLPLLDLTRALLNPALLRTGDLNLFGLTNPLAVTPTNRLLWGRIADWTTANQIIWGSTIYDMRGQQIIWGSSYTVQDNQLIWGNNAVLTADDPDRR